MLADFFRKKKTPSSKGKPFSLTRDIHAHLLPRVDDGPASMEEAVTLIRGFQRLGFTRLTATPHVYHQYYPNHKIDLVDAFAKLKNELIRQDIPLEIDLAAEYFLDEHFEALLQRKEVLPLAGIYLLVETSFATASSSLHNLFFRIQTSGYKPILAHPERYLYFTTEDYERLLEYGCQFQANLLSFAGHYGSTVQKRAFFLLRKGYYHALGSDVHNEFQLKILADLLEEIPDPNAFKQKWLNDFI